MKSKTFLLISSVMLSLLPVGAVYDGAFATPKTVDPGGLTVHEWGTFTSVAGEQGQPVRWHRWGGTDDLPCFVNNFGGFKGALPALVRMETPVLYFYATRNVEANVKVQFPQCTITEWYPDASVTASRTIEWRNVAVQPNAKPDLPAAGRSHYYTARETDAALLRVGPQKEKFLFYRGVGNFPLPLSAQITENGSVVVKNLGDAPIPGVILFENRGGNRRFYYAGTIEKETGINPQWAYDAAVLESQLKNVLAENGLHEREAQAMVDTWRDSWFEEGSRLFYIVPRQNVESILPLHIQPAPQQIERVFVGRMELITPAVQDDVKRAVDSNDRRTLEKYGRFLEVIADRARIKSPLIGSVYSEFVAKSASCVR